MKTGFNKVFLGISLFLFALPAFAMPGTIVAAVFFNPGTWAFAATAFAVNMIASAIITKAYLSANQPGGPSGDSTNPGNRQQVPPATDNKLPVVYGQSWVGGTIVDLSITADNQQLYYVLALCEVTNNGADTITFGDVYWGGKKCTFANATSASVVSLTDESTGAVDTSVNGLLEIYLYNNGSSGVVRGGLSAITVMESSGLVYTWDSTKLMTNTAFAILKITYSTDANLTGIQQTKFQITNSRYAPGDCFYDYLTNNVYGAALSPSQVDTASLSALNTYSAQPFTYTPSTGGSATQARFRFDGLLNTNRNIMDNLQDMSSCCDCLLRYNEITAQWGVVVQSPTYTVAMALNDSNLVSAIQISPTDIAGSYNVIECKFPDKQNQDAFNSTTFDLAQIAPGLLYPNEPVNKQSISLPLVNDNVRAQYLAIRMLKASREDLQVLVSVSFEGIQLEAGDIVSITNANYGWTNKEFRILKVTEDFGTDGSVTAKLSLSEFNSAIYDDVPITAFTPSPNTGISDPLVFGTIPAPVVGAQYPLNDNPFFLVNITASSAGIIQYAELWYSAFASPTSEQRIFAGTTAIQSNGTPYAPNTILPSVTVASIPAGTWYFFSRMVNSLGTSTFSSASTAFTWRPTTFQYSERYLSVAYADNATGTSNFSLNPANRLYYGLFNTISNTVSTNPADYTWYLADPTFGTNKYLCYANRTSRKFSFASGFADYAAGTGAFIPTQAIIFDPRLWSALPNGTNTIDLDYSTGQVLQTGTTTVGTGEIEVINNPDGRVVAALKPYLDFGSGIYQQSVTGSSLITIDIYGRVIGFETPDVINMTIANFTATSGQTVFTVTRNANYIQDQCLVFDNGVLQETSTYTDTNGSTGTVTFTTGRTLNDSITIISFRSVSNISLTTTGASGTGTVATLTFATRNTAPFVVGETITVAGVTPAGYNGNYTVTACTTNSVSYANTTTGAQTVAGTVAYRNNTYRTFSRNAVSLTNASSYTPSFTINNGYEFIFLNGISWTEQDYDLVGTDLTNFPSIVTGSLNVIQWLPNNLGVPTGNVVNVITNTVIGQTNYVFSYTTGALSVYQNGVLMIGGTDYTAVSNGYTLTNSPTTVNNVLLQQTFARSGAA